MVRILVRLAATGAILSLCLVAAGQVAESTERVSGPYVHDNLTVFFIHGTSDAALDDVITLSEAMARGVVTVHETGAVSELQIENTGDYPIFVHAGDIVKGGRQDRCLRFDMIVAARSGKTSLPSFCVEQGRWSGRSGEDDRAFGSSNNMVASKELKLAAKSRQSQQEVWSEVSEMQRFLSAVAGESVRGGRSATSLQLTLEHDAVQKLKTGYVDALNAELERYDDVIGFAFAINGVINNADIYCSADLFAKMWPKLLDATATEAAARSVEKGPFEAVSVTDVEEWLATSATANFDEREVNDRTRLYLGDKDGNAVFETFDKVTGKLIHKNVIKE